MIAYIEKGCGLHEAVASAGHWLRKVDGQWVASDEAAVQAIIDAYPASSTAAPVIVEIKMRAREIILARYPEWKQANMTARSVELTEKLATGIALTDTEQAELAAMKAVWSWIKTVRTASDTHEAALAVLVAADDFGGILAYNWRAGWPE